MSYINLFTGRRGILRTGAVAIYDLATVAAASQSVASQITGGPALQLGATAGSEASDPTITSAGLVCVTAQYCLTGDIAAVSMAGNWSVMMVGKFDGVANPIFSLADSTTTNNYNCVNLGGIDGTHSSLSIQSRNASTNNSSSGVSVLKANYVCVSCVSSGGTLTLTLMHNGANATLANVNPLNTPRLGIGVLARSAVSPIADSMTATYFTLHSRALTASQQQKAYRWMQAYLKGKGVTVT